MLYQVGLLFSFILSGDKRHTDEQLGHIGFNRDLRLTNVEQLIDECTKDDEANTKYPDSYCRTLHKSARVY
jgi:hypothetical protein